MLQYVCALVVLCAVVETYSDRVMCDGCRNQYVRIKRGKYPGPPQRFYSRPPSYAPKGIYSYTPPPAHMIDNDESYPGSYRPSKVSRRPSEGLGDGDINNLVKYLSKQDLDKIIEFAGGNRHEQYRDGPFTNELKPTRDENRIYKATIPDSQEDKTYDSNPNVNYATDSTPSKIYYTKPLDNPNQGYSNAPIRNEETQKDSYPNYSQQDLYQSSNKDVANDFNQEYSSVPLHTEESMRYTQVSVPNGGNSFSDSITQKEEQLPRPLNLRQEDYDVSFTNNVPSVVKPSNSYKVESFGDLPLMNYNSKLHSLSSYHVPHYTVTTQVKPLQSSSSHSKTPSIEPAPPVSAAKDQSDAHLKAIRIWSHKSKGTAYTLHKDGTLSLELPGRKPYGHH